MIKLGIQEADLGEKECDVGRVCMLNQSRIFRRVSRSRGCYASKC